MFSISRVGDGAVLFESRRKVDATLEAAVETAARRGVPLDGAELSYGMYIDARLRKLRARGAYFSCAQMARADLRDADLRGACMRSVDAQEADFRGADLREADLRRSYLQRARFEGARLDKARIDLANIHRVGGAESFVGAHMHADVGDVRIRKILQIEGSAHTITAVVLARDARSIGEVRVKIGCTDFKLCHWLGEHERIGHDAGYSEEQIKEYLEYLKQIHVWARGKERT
jgi:hypothetical protein